MELGQCSHQPSLNYAMEFFFNNWMNQKLKREHHLTRALQNQSNKHQNSQKPMLKAEQKIYQLHA